MILLNTYHSLKKITIVVFFKSGSKCGKGQCPCIPTVNVTVFWNRP